MSRVLALAVVGGLAAVASGCYEPAYIPKKPRPEKIVRHNAIEEMNRAFTRKPELRKDLPKFLEKLGDADTTHELREAWLTVYPGYPFVLDRAISKSINDFYWPVAPVRDGRVYVEGFRRAAEDLVEETPQQS
jgi:hypothetical protein